MSEGEAVTCAHEQTRRPTHPIPDWTETCPNCGERVKHNGRGGFITVREVNARLAAQHQAVEAFRRQWWLDHAEGEAVRPSVIDRVWLCPVHAEEFWVPHGGICPAVGCEQELRVYWSADEVEPLRHALQRIANAAELNLGFVAQRQIAQDALRRFSGGGAS